MDFDGKTDEELEGFKTELAAEQARARADMEEVEAELERRRTARRVEAEIAGLSPEARSALIAGAAAEASADGLEGGQ